MSKIMVVGSINMDIILKVAHIPSIGETIIAKTCKKVEKENEQIKR
ncbi:hypothetical protein [Thermoanaerobacterium sp. RBIITD]|nr:hypothetical protein [Thermoanaerobacterium sp. RBIITD]